MQITGIEDMLGRMVRGQFLRNRRRTNILAYIHFFFVSIGWLLLYIVFILEHTHICNVHDRYRYAKVVKVVSCDPSIRGCL